MNDSWKEESAPVPLEAATIHVWRIGQLEHTPNRSVCTALLDCEERDRASCFKREEDQLRFTIGRASLRRLLAGYCQADPAALRFEQNEYGKPRLPESFPNRISFNVAHSGGIILCAFAQTAAIGVDVEKARPGIEHDKLAARFFSPAETAAFLALPEETRAAAFHQYWVCKEAVLKALGTGLSTPLDSFSISFAQPERPAARFEGALRQTPFYLHLLNPAEGHAAAVAVMAPEPQRIECFTLLPIPRSRA